MRCSSTITLGCPFSSPIFWKLSSSILSLVVGFFVTSLTHVGVCFVSSTHSFKYCVGPRVGAWLLTYPITLTFRLSLVHVLTTLHIQLGLPHPTVAYLSRCQCGHTIDDLNTHFLECPYRSECTTTHDTFWDIVITIVLESETQIWCNEHIQQHHMQ